MKYFFSQKIKIEKRIITQKSTPFVVAEVSANHGSSLKNIKDIMDPKKVINPGALSLNVNDERD